MPQLETLVLIFASSFLNRDVESKFTQTRIIAPDITLPNLHYLHFQGVSNYLGTLVHRITAPLPENLLKFFFTNS